LSFIYLMRHAQAGSRDNYDVLSDLGHEQARRVGESFSNQQIEFSSIYSGTMRRQRHTAEIVRSVLSRSSAAPEIVSHEQWNEFSLLSVYRAIADRLAQESPEFAGDFREMQEALRRDPHTTRGATGRCDAAVIRAWMSNRYPDYEGESWAGFRDRIKSCLPEIFTNGVDGSVAVFTSATPIAILVGAALELSEEKLLSILGVIYNASVTVLRRYDDQLRLFSFNEVSHLSKDLKTFR
jgi:broad specificity phosphatase PhoE